LNEVWRRRWEKMVLGIGKEKMGYKAKYLGGHGAFPKAMDCKIILFDKYLEIPEFPMQIPYENITNVQSQTQEKITLGRVLLTGVLALAWKKKKLFMVLSYKENEVEHNMVFDVDKIEEVQPAIYRKMMAAKAGKK
jgi:hypothetical protein